VGRRRKRSSRRYYSLSKRISGKLKQRARIRLAGRGSDLHIRSHQGAKRAKTKCPFAIGGIPAQL